MVKLGKRKKGRTRQHKCCGSQTLALSKPAQETLRPPSLRNPDSLWTLAHAWTPETTFGVTNAIIQTVHLTAPFLFLSDYFVAQYHPH